MNAHRPERDREVKEPTCKYGTAYEVYEECVRRLNGNPTSGIFGLVIDQISKYGNDQEGEWSFDKLVEGVLEELT